MIIVDLFLGRTTSLDLTGKSIVYCTFFSQNSPNEVLNRWLQCFLCRVFAEVHLHGLSIMRTQTVLRSVLHKSQYLTVAKTMMIVLTSFFYETTYLTTVYKICSLCQIPSALRVVFLFVSKNFSATL